MKSEVLKNKRGIGKLAIKMLVLVMLICVATVCNSENAAAKKKAYIKASKYVGKYGLNGDSGSYEEGGYTITIKKIYGNKVKFKLNRWGMMASPSCTSNTIVATIKGKTAKFKFKDIEQMQKGNGTLTFNKDKSLTLKVKVTKYEYGPGYGLDIKKSKFYSI
ncbi:MAG: hypothetical protein E7265_02820 [Lachnospiraceae bacterium]|nr:hypothetical protein [Lachnospiraceae bacterium]